MLARLSETFPPFLVEWRVGATNLDKTKGMALAYIDARTVQDRLDNVVGPQNWQSRFHAVGDKTCCEIGIRMPWSTKEEWIWKSDGAGDTDFEGAKGAFSDAFKRAAVRWGVGRYLYDLRSPWEDIDERKNFTKAALERLDALLDGGQFHGPLGISDLKKELKSMAAEITEITDLGSWDSFIQSKRNLIDQCQRDLGSWYYGQEGTDNRGLLLRMEEKREELLRQVDNPLEGG